MGRLDGGGQRGGEGYPGRVIPYTSTVYRPPSEARSLILQATIGCSYNRCTFCGMYRDRPFRVRKLEELEEEIQSVAALDPGMRRVFLADGDALIARANFLEAVLEALHRAFPRLQRVSCYASPQALRVRTVAEMAHLRTLGLTLYYLGVESGEDRVLAALDKGVDSAEMVRVAAKANDAGVKLSTMILLGAGGRELSEAHAQGSAAVINRIQPRYLSTLAMMPVPGTPLFEQVERGAYTELAPEELAAELRTFLAELELSGTIFRSNHASNYLALAGTLPKDKGRLLAELDTALADPGHAPFRHEWQRGL